MRKSTELVIGQDEQAENIDAPENNGKNDAKMSYTADCSEFSGLETGANVKPSVFHDENVVGYAPENDEGNVEYKWRLLDVSEERLDHLTTQMKV